MRIYPGKLFELPEVLATEGSHSLNVMQKGGHPARPGSSCFSGVPLSAGKHGMSCQNVSGTVYIGVPDYLALKFTLFRSDVSPVLLCRACCRFRHVTDLQILNDDHLMVLLIVVLTL